MKLLVAGDSFAEFAHYHGYQTHIGAKKLQPNILEENSDKEFDHWCQLVAKHNNGSAVTLGLQGAGIGLTSFLAMQELVKDNTYTHVINFVSHHMRTEIMTMHPDSGPPVDAWRKFAEPVIRDPYKKNPREEHWFYNSHEPKVAFGGAPMPNQPMCYNKMNAENLLSDHQDELAALPSNRHYSYMTSIPCYQYVHSNVGHVMALDAYCKNNRIKIIHAVAFAGGIISIIESLNIKINTFDIVAVEKERDLECLHNWPTHYDGNSHAVFFEEFQKQHSNYFI